MWWKRLFFTGFYSGYSPVAPGTAGTVLALIIYIVEYFIFGEYARICNLVIVILLLYPAVKLGDVGERFFGEKDPQQIVLDEMMGYWISLLFFPFNRYIIILAFLLFRAFDIIKPYPIREMEKFKGGFGIMIDDYISGVYTNILIRIIIFISSLYGINIFQ